jgi:hypothetical protein
VSDDAHDEMLDGLADAVASLITTIAGLRATIDKLEATVRQLARERDRARLALAMARGDPGAWPLGWTSPYRLQWNAPGDVAWISAAIDDCHIVGWMLYWIGPSGSYQAINEQPYPDLVEALDAYQAKVNS